MLKCIARPRDFERRLQQNHQIEFQAPVVDVPEIIFDALLDGRTGWRRSATSVHLRPASQARFNATPKRVVSHHLVKLVVMGERVRAGAHEAHAAVQHVEQLRKLVDAGSPQPFPNAGDALVAGARLNHRLAVLQHMHRSEFANGEVLAVEAATPLLEEDWPGRIEFDRDCDGNQQGREQQEREAGADDIQRPLSREISA